MESRRPVHLEQAAIRLVGEPPLYSDFPMDSPQAVVKLLADGGNESGRDINI